MKKYVQTLTAFVVALAGCVAIDSSYKTIVLNPPLATVSQAPPAVVVAGVAEVVNKTTGQAPAGIQRACPIYIPTAIPSVPPAPLAKFGETPLSNQAEREAILLEYIKTLRLHIASARKANSDNYKNYISKCASE